MHEVSSEYKAILARPHRIEVRLSVNDAAPEDAYGSSTLISLKTSRKTFAQNVPAVGGCVAGEISITMLFPEETIPRQAKLIPYIRLASLQVLDNPPATQYSEWVQKGVYYIDTRRKKEVAPGLYTLTIQGYDDILRTEQLYPPSSLSWPAYDIDAVNEIAAYIGVEVDERTTQIMANGYQVGDPTGYSCREVLGYIAAMYGGCFVMSDLGKLQLIALGDVTADDDVETNYLINEEFDVITFGGDRILV